MWRKKTAHFFKNEKNGQAQKKKKALDGGHKKTPFRKKRASFKKTKTWAHGLIQKKTKRKGDGGKQRCPSEKKGLLIGKKKGAENGHIKK